MGEEVEELVKRLRERAYVVAAKAFIMDDDTARNAKLFVAAANELESLRASLTRVEEERDDLRQSVIAFAAPHAARYAKEFGFAPDELHPTHYDILEKCGARMDSFKRADLSRATSAEGK